MTYNDKSSGFIALHVRVSPQEKKRVYAEAEKRNVTASDLIRKAIDKYLTETSEAL